MGYVRRVMGEVLIVIPAYNEESTISRVVTDCCKFGEVVVIDDGSVDKTSSRASEAGAWVIINTKNKGYDDALNQGYEYAISKNYDIMLSIDADGQLPAEKIPDFIAKIKAGHGVVIGARTKLTRSSERVLALASSCFLGIEDPYCGMKAYKLASCYGKRRFADYNSTGTDLMLTLALAGLTVSNLPIKVKERQGVSRFGGRLASEARLLPSLLMAVFRMASKMLTTRVRN